MGVTEAVWAATAASVSVAAAGAAAIRPSFRGLMTFLNVDTTAGVVAAGIGGELTQPSAASSAAGARLKLKVCWRTC